MTNCAKLGLQAAEVLRHVSLMNSHLEWVVMLFASKMHTGVRY